MNRRDLLRGGAAALAVLGRLAPARAADPADPADPSDARYADAIVIDGLGNLDDPYAPTPRGPMPPTLAADVRRSGATAFHMTVGGPGETAFRDAVTTITRYDAWIAANPGRLSKVTAAVDIARAKAAGGVGLVYGFQGCDALGNDLERVALLRTLGIRIMQPTYNSRNLFGDGCLEPADGGLSRLGRGLIARLEAERVLLDLSHAGPRTIADGIAAATRPPLITHTGCRALHDHPRNVGDGALRALAAKGGVVGIYWMQFLAASNHPDGAEVVRHMAHAVSVCGEDHVAIGTDGMLGARLIDDKYRAFQRRMYEERTASGIAAPGEAPGVFNVIPEWDGPDRFRRLAAALDRARWPARRIDKVLGGNLMRVYAEGWGG